MRRRNGGLPRGIFERHPGSGIYWIRYADATGRERKEKVGPRLSIAVTLYQKRKIEAFETRKLVPELRRRDPCFGPVRRAEKALDRTRIEKALQDNPSRLLFPQEETAQILSISIGALRNRISDGRIRVMRIGHKTLIPRTELEKLIRDDKS